MAFDFQTTITQGAADKVVGSVSYPFTVIDRRTPYERLARLSEDSEGEASDAADGEAAAELAGKDLEDLLEEVAEIRAGGRAYSRLSDLAEQQDLAFEMNDALGAIATNAGECLAAQAAVEKHNERNPGSRLDWDGPSADELREIIEAASDAEPTLARLAPALGDWGIKALVTWIKVSAGKRPRFRLNGRSFSVGVDPVIDGTGEAWLKHPWLKCVKKKWGICYAWKKIVKHSQLLSVTLRGLKFTLDVRADVSTEGALVRVRGHVVKLRIDHRYLDRIPLEKLANGVLTQKPITVFDASRLIATLPVLGSKFGVEAIDLADREGEITVEVAIRQI